MNNLLPRTSKALLSTRQAVLALFICAGLVAPWCLHAQTFSQTETIEYHDDTAKWVLGQVKRVTVNGIETSKTDYDSNAMPWQIHSYGKLQQTLTYDTTSTDNSGQRGTLKTIADGNGNVTTLGNWKRGIPQVIQFPATPDQPGGASMSAVVDDNGWITSVTNEVASRTCYQYDLMGRVSKITYPSESAANTCDASKWATTDRVFGPAQTARYGLPANHWEQIVTTGNSVSITYYDSLWRPVVVERYDNANASNTRSIVVTRYNTDGSPVFQSYPVADLYDFNGLTYGTTTTYDPLNRVTRIEQTSELGTLTTTKWYEGVRVHTQNPRQQGTTQETFVGHVMYDQPSYDLPRAVIAPEDQNTFITRDSQDRVVSIYRRNSSASLGATRAYVYDGYSQLCKVIEPETGATIMGYDNAGNLLWSAAGVNAPSTTSCDTATGYNSGRRVDRTYDQRNRLMTLTFPDGGLGNQNWTYTADSLPATVTAYNGAGNTLPLVNTYTYNHRRLPTAESLTDWYTWAVGYGYDANANLAQHSYQSGLSNETITYAPNALGQATQVIGTYGTYATGAQYYPNGALKQFTYGNGIVHTMIQNDRQLPAWSTDTPGVFNDAYTYDRNGNVQSITDHTNGRHTRAMTYDGMDRLLTATSPMYPGGASYSYNVLDDLTQVTAPGRSHWYCYNGSTRQLTFLRSGPDCSTSPAVVALTYDPQGNVTAKNAASYGFDYGNRLRTVNVGAVVEAYRYDAQGRRTLAWNSAGGNVYSIYTQDGAIRIQQDERKGKQYSFLYLAGSQVARREVPMAGGASIITYQHTDALGSPIAVTNSGGTVIAAEASEYEPYGKLLNRANDDRPGYTGHVMDQASGLTYMQQRYYDPGIGRFLSVDPVTALSDPVGYFGRYHYAMNNPYRFIDPDGRSPQDRWYEFTNKRFQDWVHGEKQLEGRRGAQNYSRSELKQLHNEWKQLGEPRGKGGVSGSGGSQRGQRGFFAPGILLKANVIIYLLTYSGDLNASELGGYDRWMEEQEKNAKNDSDQNQESEENSDRKKEPPPPPPPPEEREPDKVWRNAQ